MNKSKLLFYFLFLHLFCFAQKESLSLAINKSIALVDRIENNCNTASEILKKVLAKKDTNIVKKTLANVLALAENTELKAKQSENYSDEIQQNAKKAGCNEAAQEADDAEDYCRHLVFQTHEIVLYTKKAIAESDVDLIQTYINKALAYSLDAYESTKNAQIELSDALKDLNNCP